MEILYFAYCLKIISLFCMYHYKCLLLTVVFSAYFCSDHYGYKEAAGLISLSAAKLW